MTAKLTSEQVVELADMFRLLGERSRLRLILACLETPQTVGALVEQLGQSQTLVSHHLRLLRTAHILRGEREGRQVRYAIDDAHVRDVVRNMVAHLVEPHGHRSTPETSTGSEETGDDEMATEKCACTDCVCKVETDKAVVTDGKAYCSQACADGHKEHAGCDHAGCNCHG